MSVHSTSPGLPAFLRAPAAGRFHIPSLDGIRALSFLLVFVAHAGLGNIVPGGFAVTVFFFLSGYLITTLMRMEFDASGTVDLKQFYLRRVFRILPAFYLVLGLALIAAQLGLIAGHFDPRAVAAQAFHVANYWVVGHGYDGMPQGTGVTWSLAVEEHFYLVFPVLYLGLRRVLPNRRAQALVFSGVCALCLAWRCGLVYLLHVSEYRTYVASDTHLDSILFGCILAVYGNPMLDGPSRVAERSWKYGLLPAGVLLLMATLVYRDPAFRETFRYSLQGLALFPIFVTALRFPTWGPCRVLNTHVARRFGALSYSLYLVHHVILHAVEAHSEQAAWLQGALALTLSLCVAGAIYHFVEQPCTRLRKLLSRPAVAAAPSYRIAPA